MVPTPVPYDSTYQVCDTIKANPLFNGMYVSGADAKMSDPLKRAILINYSQQNKINFLALYSMGNVWGSSTKEPATNTFISEAHAKGIKVAPVISNKTEVAAADAFNKKYTNDFDWILREKEIWNLAVSAQAAGIVSDSSTADSEKAVALKYAMSPYGTYVGWDAQNGRFFKMVTFTSSAIFLHVYRTNPLDWSYARGRITDFNNYCKGLGITLPVIIIVSYEPGFSQTWAKTNSLDKIDAYFQPLINGFSNLKYFGKLHFTDNFMMVSIPYKAPAAAMARTQEVNYNEGFTNETTQEHRQYLPWHKRLNLLNKENKKIRIPVDSSLYNQTKSLE